VTDAAKAFYLIAQNGKPFCEYVVGGGNARPLREYLLEMQTNLAPNNNCIFGDVPFTGKDLPLEAFSTKQTEKDCGYIAEVDFLDGVKMTMDWIKNND
jgi:nucleoside-diphosphate-sugar epimerase